MYYFTRKGSQLKNDIDFVTHYNNFDIPKSLQRREKCPLCQKVEQIYILLLLTLVLWCLVTYCTCKTWMRRKARVFAFTCWHGRLGCERHRCRWLGVVVMGWMMGCSACEVWLVGAPMLLVRTLLIQWPSRWCCRWWWCLMRHLLKSTGRHKKRQWDLCMKTVQERLAKWSFSAVVFH